MQENTSKNTYLCQVNNPVKNYDEILTPRRGGGRVNEILGSACRSVKRKAGTLEPIWQCDLSPAT
jgi:hypothetical protein